MHFKNMFWASRGRDLVVDGTMCGWDALVPGRPKKPPPDRQLRVGFGGYLGVGVGGIVAAARHF
jgi:hypothetical protein